MALATCKAYLPASSTAPRQLYAEATVISSCACAGTADMTMHWVPLASDA